MAGGVYKTLDLTINFDSGVSNVILYGSDNATCTVSGSTCSVYAYDDDTYRIDMYLNDGYEIADVEFTADNDSEISDISEYEGFSRLTLKADYVDIVGSITITTKATTTDDTDDTDTDDEGDEQNESSGGGTSMNEITINGVKCNGVEVNGIKVGDDYYIFKSGSGGGSSVEGGYEVTFMDGETIFAVVSVQKGAAVNSLSTVPSEDSSGYAFIGWSTSESADDIISLPFTPTANTTLYAVYGAYSTLEDNTWEMIRAVSDAGTAANMWAVGDTHSVSLVGTMGSYLTLSTTLYIFIVGINHNSSLEGENIIHFQGFKTSAGVNVCLVDSGYGSGYTSGKYLNMNHWGNYNYGGWAGCDARYDILGSTDVAPSGYGSAVTTSRVGYDPSDTCTSSPVTGTLMACLSDDFRANMKIITKYQDNTGNASNVAANVTATKDYIPLPSEFEIFGSRTYANVYEQNYQKQYDYYANGNSKVKYQHSSTSTTAYWWERSAPYGSTTNFCLVNASGSATNSNACNSRGFAPLFGF